MPQYLNLEITLYYGKNIAHLLPAEFKHASFNLFETYEIKLYMKL